MNTPVLNFDKTRAFFNKKSLLRTISNLKEARSNLPKEFVDSDIFDDLIRRLELSSKGHVSEAFIVVQDAERYGQSVLGAMIVLSEDDRVNKLTLALIGNDLVSMHSSGVDYM